MTPCGRKMLSGGGLVDPPYLGAAQSQGRGSGEETGRGGERWEGGLEKRPGLPAKREGRFQHILFNLDK